MIHLWINAQKLLLQLANLVSVAQWRPVRSRGGIAATSSMSVQMIEGIWRSVRSRR